MVAIPFGDTKDDNPSVITGVQDDRDKVIQALTDGVPPVDSDPKKEHLRSVVDSLLDKDPEVYRYIGKQYGEGLEDLEDLEEGDHETKEALFREEYYRSMGFVEGNTSPHDMAQYLDVIHKDIALFGQSKDRKTGFANLDEKSKGLYPGLYVIGAISSLGKTTFIHQIGDQLAAAGDHVLFFSLEQNRLEMATKSLSRLTAQMDEYRAVSSINIRRGAGAEIVKEAIEEYKRKIGSRMNIIECNFDTNINFIKDYTLHYAEINQVSPVVIVDYLQIIPPTDPTQQTRERIDSTLLSLKKMQSDNKLVVFVVSSVNRSNYLYPIDFESFKESGCIEYTADVVYGLQLQALADPVFAKPNNIKAQRDCIKKAKAEIPRRVELVCIKNRYGVASYSCGFDYDPRYDLFTVDNDYVPDGEYKERSDASDPKEESNFDAVLEEISPKAKKKQSSRF